MVSIYLSYASLTRPFGSRSFVILFLEDDDIANIPMAKLELTNEEMLMASTNSTTQFSEVQKYANVEYKINTVITNERDPKGRVSEA